MNGFVYNDEDNAPMSDSLLPAEKNCHERCNYSKICYEKYHFKGSHDPNYPWECPMYDKINDLVNDTVPFCDPGEPEEGELDDDT